MLVYFSDDDTYIRKSRIALYWKDLLLQPHQNLFEFHAKQIRKAKSTKKESSLQFFAFLTLRPLREKYSTPASSESV
jgi:hypothetical protein